MRARGETSLSPQRPHLSVMLDQVLGALKPRAGEVYVDGTFGAGGYSEAFLQAADCTVIAIDRDPDVVLHADRLSRLYGDRFQFVAGAFGDLAELLRATSVQSLDGVILDLGVSSMQLDEAQRGFSFMRDGPLDMRMSQDGVSALDVVNQFSASDLARILSVYGDERRSKAVAQAIIRARAQAPILRTSQLVDIVTSVLGAHHGKGSHPATRTFQALRIFVNDEMGELIRGLIAAEQSLSEDGRLVVVSFHSLEDRVVKKFLTARCGRAGRPSRHMPDINERPQSFSDMVRLDPSQDEIAQNTRARSARLRAARRTSALPWPVESFLPPMPDLSEVRP